MTAASPSGLTVSPFTENPDAPVFVESDTHRKAVAQARFGIEQGGGLVVITGEPGSGKSAVLDRAAMLVAGENAAVMRLSANELDGASLEDVVLRALRAVDEDTDPDADLETALLNCREVGVTPALLIDDADDLGDEGLRALSRLADLEDDGDPLLRIVIAGRPALRSVFYRDDMADLRQMIASSCQLSPLSREEVADYFDARIRGAGFAGEVAATVSFLDALAEVSGGNPGRVNRLAGRAVTKAGVDGRSELRAEDLEMGEGTDDVPDAEVIEDAEVVATEPPVETPQPAMSAGVAPPRAGPITITELNAAIEQLGQYGASSITVEASSPQPADDDDDMFGPEDDDLEPAADAPEAVAPAQVADDEPAAENGAEPEDIWEPASPLSEEEELALDAAEFTPPAPGDQVIVADMQGFVSDIREQIDSLRKTLETLRGQAEKMEALRRNRREKVSGRLDSIKSRIEELRRGE